MSELEKNGLEMNFRKKKKRHLCLFSLFSNTVIILFLLYINI